MNWRRWLHKPIITRRNRGRWWLGLNPDVIQYLPDIGALRDERNQARLPTAQRSGEFGASTPK